MEEIPALDPQEFIETFLYAEGVGSGRIPDAIRAPTDFKFLMEDGEVASLADIPLHRTGMAVMQRFRGRENEGAAFMERYWALKALMRTPLLAEYQRPCEDPGATEVHPAVLKVAAREPLPTNGEFAPQAFLASVVRLAASDSGPCGS